MTTGFTFTATCPTCGGPLSVANPGGTNGKETKAVVRCANPRHGDYLIYAVIQNISSQGGNVDSRWSGNTQR